VFLLITFILFSILALKVCWKKEEKNDPTNAANNNTIVVWHWMTDRHQTLLKLADQYKVETGKQVHFELNAPSDLYSTKVIAAAQTGSLPEIFGVLGGSQDMARFINKNYIHSLTKDMEIHGSEWKNSFFVRALGMNTFEENNQWSVPPGIYGVPLDVTNIQILYNEAIFQEAGISKLPETFAEFIQAGDTVKAKTGKHFFVSGFGETWLINSMVMNFAHNLMGEEKIIKTFKGDIPYTDPDWIAVFSKFKEMTDHKLFASGVVTMVNKSAERLFATEKAAVTYNGSWCVNVYKTMNPQLNYDTLFFPKISDLFPVVIQGGAGSSFVVSAHSSKKEEAVQFLKWLTSKNVQITLAQDTNNLPSNKNALGQTSKILDAFVRNMDNTIHPSTLPCVEDALVEEAIGRGIQSIIIEEITPKKLAESLHALKQKIKLQNAN
jgi:ABC-type glycerol-3-phosphate transport system substrate-binding protein